MVAAPDGRTINGADHQLEVLGGHESTQHFADELAVIKKNVAGCAVLRPHSVEVADIIDIHTGIDFVAPKFPPQQWPFVCRTALWERAMRDERNTLPASIAKRTFPFDPEVAFDPKNPVLMGFKDQDEAAKVAMCERVLFKEVLVSMIKEGVPKEQSVLSIVRQMLVLYDNMDPLDASPLAKERVLHWKIIARYLELLCDYEIGASHEVTSLLYYFYKYK